MLLHVLHVTIGKSLEHQSLEPIACFLSALRRRAEIDVARGSTSRLPRLPLKWPPRVPCFQPITLLPASKMARYCTDTMDVTMSPASSAPGATAMGSIEVTSSTVFEQSILLSYKVAFLCHLRTGNGRYVSPFAGFESSKSASKHFRSIVI